MRVRALTPRERHRLQPWYQPWGSPYKRKADAAEQIEIIHLYRTGQETPERLARRFGVSVRTVYRYLRGHPDPQVRSAAGLRVSAEAQSIGLRLTPADAERLAVAALIGGDDR